MEPTMLQIRCLKGAINKLHASKSWLSSDKQAPICEHMPAALILLWVVVDLCSGSIIVPLFAIVEVAWAQTIFL